MAQRNPEHRKMEIYHMKKIRSRLSFEDSAVRDVVYTVSKQGSKITITEGGTSFALKR